MSQNITVIIWVFGQVIILMISFLSSSIILNNESYINFSYEKRVLQVILILIE